jgi:DNA-binding MarR family transcriptional regulator
MPNHRDDASLGDVHVQLKMISRLMAAQLKATSGQQQVVRILAGSGASHAEIADVLGTTPATVTVTLKRLRKKDASQDEGDSAGDDSSHV